MTRAARCRVAPAGPELAEVVAGLESAGAQHPWSLDAIRGTLALPTTRAWLAWRGPRAVGELLASSVAGVGEVLTLVVHPEARRQGIAGALLRRCTAQWREEGVFEAFLEVREDNLPAQALYRTLGWVEVGRRRGYYADGRDARVLRWEASC